MRLKTVNLAEIATGFSGKAKVESHYKRLQRFFRGFNVDYKSIALMVVKVMKTPEPWIISIDRTDWQFGKTVFNVLTLGVMHHGVAFPLVWIMLDKKGNSNTREHCELWNRFLEIFGNRKIDFLTADWEFVGEEWFDWDCQGVKAEVSANIEVADEVNALAVQGRIDILIIQERFWVLVIESKPARIDVTAGIPQALTYLLSAPNLQSSCYGMVTNGREVLFLKWDRHQNTPEYTRSPTYRFVENATERIHVSQGLKQIGDDIGDLRS